MFNKLIQQINVQTEVEKQTAYVQACVQLHAYKYN